MFWRHFLSAASLMGFWSLITATPKLECEIVTHSSRLHDSILNRCFAIDPKYVEKSRRAQKASLLDTRPRAQPPPCERAASNM